MNRSAGVMRFLEAMFNPGTRLSLPLSGLETAEAVEEYIALTNNPYDSPSADASSPKPQVPRSTSQASWAAIFIPLLVQMLLTCACGHLHIYLLPITLGVLWFSVHAYSKPNARTFVGLIGVAVAILFAAKHVADILWLGHDPLISL